MQGHTFSSFYIYRSLLINKPRINEVFVSDMYIIPDIFWKSKKRFEVSAFEGSLFSGLISGSCYIFSILSLLSEVCYTVFEGSLLSEVYGRLSMGSISCMNSLDWNFKLQYY